MTTDRTHIEKAIRALWAARLKEDVDASLKDLADDGAFGLNAKGVDPALVSVKGKAAVKPVLQQLYDQWKFTDWKEIALLVDGDKALLHWRARATFSATNKSDIFDVFDVITFRDGKIVDYRQTTDTAQMMTLTQ